MPLVTDLLRLVPQPSPRYGVLGKPASSQRPASDRAARAEPGIGSARAERMHWPHRTLLAPTLALAIGTHPMHAQGMPAGQSTGVQPVVSMGQPPVWQLHTAGLGRIDFPG